MNATLTAPSQTEGPPAAPTVADLAAFEALPEEIQLLARRVLAGGEVVAGGLAVAYRAGWEDCADEMGPPMAPSLAEAEVCAREALERHAARRRRNA